MDFLMVVRTAGTMYVMRASKLAVGRGVRRAVVMVVATVELRADGMVVWRAGRMVEWRVVAMVVAMVETMTESKVVWMVVRMAERMVVETAGKMVELRAVLMALK